MKFCWCTISVNDMEQSLMFYQEIVGLPLKNRYPAGPGVEIAFLGDSDTQVELICNKNQNTANVGDGISLGFEVKSLEEEIKWITDKSLTIDSGPFQPNPHVRFFFVRDPNGVRIQFVENIK